MSKGSIITANEITNLYLYGQKKILVKVKKLMILF